MPFPAGRFGTTQSADHSALVHRLMTPLCKIRSRISPIVATLPTAILSLSSKASTHNFPAKTLTPFSSSRLKRGSNGGPSAKSLTAVFQQIITTGLSSRFGKVSSNVARISKPRSASPQPQLSEPNRRTLPFSSSIDAPLY